MPHVYDLTAYTGQRKSQQRRTVVLTVETTNRALLINLAGIIAALPIVALLYPFLGLYTLGTFLLTVPLAHFLASRRRNGLQISQLRALNNRLGVTRGWRIGINGIEHSHKLGQIIMAGRPLATPQIRELIPIIIPNPDYDPDSRSRDRRSGLTTAPQRGPIARGTGTTRRGTARLINHPQ